MIIQQLLCFLSCTRRAHSFPHRLNPETIHIVLFHISLRSIQLDETPHVSCSRRHLVFPRQHQFLFLNYDAITFSACLIYFGVTDVTSSPGLIVGSSIHVCLTAVSLISTCPSVTQHRSFPICYNHGQILHTETHANTNNAMMETLLTLTTPGRSQRSRTAS